MSHTAVENIAVHNWKRTPSVTNRSPRPMEDGMRFQVVYDSSTPVRRRHLAGADAKDRYAITRLVGLAGSIKSRHRGFCFSAPISPPLWFSAQTEKIAFNAVGFRHVRREPRRTRQSSVLLHFLSDCQNTLRILYPY